MAGDKPGPETRLEDKDTLATIRECILEGMSYKETAEVCGIPLSTFYTWRSDNYLGLADKMAVWRIESKLDRSDYNLDQILKLDVNDKDFVRPVLDASKFVKETLDKENYSKRSEITGKDGKDINQVLVKFVDGTEDNRNTN